MAHRGGAALAPENTLIAFQQAIDWWGSDILELDVHPSRDGEAVVLHDATLDRTTDGRGPVALLSLEEIRALDAGFHFSPDGGKSFPYRGSGIRIPTLAEVLAAFPGHRINVEIKAGGVQERTREVIMAANASGRVLVAAEVREHRSHFADYPGPVSASGNELRTFYLLHRTRLTRLFRPRVDAFQLPRRHRDRDVLSARLVRDAHALNIAVHVWTVDTEDEMRRLLEFGVDGIVTDRPDRLARVLHARTGRPLPPGPGADIPPFLERLLLA
jgi:glycerophosphoryl diester phosphodiesterase